MTSPAGQQAYYEITVKREPNGVFSGWLHDRITAESVVRASRPVGEYYLPLDAHAPAVCLAGGIGVTPALAMVRSLDQLTALSALHLDYSALRAEELVCANELRESAGREERLRVDLRATQAQGQLRRDHVDRLVRQYPGASFYLCGPKPFEDAVRGHLAACGVPQERIRIERFGLPAGRRYGFGVLPASPYPTAAQRAGRSRLRVPMDRERLEAGQRFRRAGIDAGN